MDDLSKNICKQCKTDPLSAESYARHILGKEHRIKRDDFGAPAKEIFVLKVTPPSNSTVREILIQMHSYNYIDAIFHFSSGTLYVHFKTRKELRYALEADVKFKGQKLSLSLASRNIMNSQDIKKHSQRSYPLLSEPLLERLAKRPSDVNMQKHLSELLECVVSCIELNKNDLTAELIRMRVEVACKRFFPECEAFLVGSAINGLGFRLSDIDIVLNIGFDIFTGSPIEINEMMDKVADKICDAINEKNVGIDAVSIHNTEVPFVRFWIPEFKIYTGISFKNGTPIYNSQLIDLYCQMHKLVRPYLMILKYWAKVQDIVNPVYSNKHMTSYAFSLLALFWLMARRDRIVPPVGELQKQLVETNPEMIVTINGWMCNFSRNTLPWNTLKHDTDLIDLIEEFFKFIVWFDSKESVICPLQGSLVLKADVERHSSSRKLIYLEDFFRHEIAFRTFPSLCIQDPFEWSKNLTEGLIDLKVESLKKRCSIALDVISDAKRRKCSFLPFFKKYETSPTDLFKSESGFYDAEMRKIHGLHRDSNKRIKRDQNASAKSNRSYLLEEDYHTTEHDYQLIPKKSEVEVHDIRQREFSSTENRIRQRKYIARLNYSQSVKVFSPHSGIKSATLQKLDLDKYIERETVDIDPETRSVPFDRKRFSNSEWQKHGIFYRVDFSKIVLPLTPMEEEFKINFFFGMRMTFTLDDEGRYIFDEIDGITEKGVDRTMHELVLFLFNKVFSSSIRIFDEAKTHFMKEEKYYLEQQETYYYVRDWKLSKNKKRRALKRKSNSKSNENCSKQLKNISSNSSIDSDDPSYKKTNMNDDSDEVRHVNNLPPRADSTGEFSNSPAKYPDSSSKSSHKSNEDANNISNGSFKPSDPSCSANTTPKLSTYRTSDPTISVLATYVVTSQGNQVFKFDYTHLRNEFKCPDAKSRLQYEKAYTDHILSIDTETPTSRDFLLILWKKKISTNIYNYWITLNLFDKNAIVIDRFQIYFTSFEKCFKYIFDETREEVNAMRSK